MTTTQTISIADGAGVPACRSCGDRSSVKSQGELQDAQRFSGTLLSAPLPGGSLFRCGGCGFVFRHPILSKERYDELYRTSTVESWDESGRVDHELLRAALRERLGSGPVLDVGCGPGTLLEPLANEFETFGVEINPDAAEVAAERGLKIIGRDLQAVEDCPVGFDAVVSCDVIEHLAEPVDFVHRMVKLARPGGLVMISTGNADAWSWRLAGSRFWYCHTPEHLSFVSPRWFETQADKFGADVVAVKRYVYTPRFSLVSKGVRLGLMALYRVSPTLYRSLQTTERRTNFPVGRGVTQDHFMVILRKRTSS